MGKNFCKIITLILFLNSGVIHAHNFAVNNPDVPAVMKELPAPSALLEWGTAAIFSLLGIIAALCGVTFVLYKNGEEQKRIAADAQKTQAEAVQELKELNNGLKMKEFNEKVESLVATLTGLRMQGNDLLQISKISHEQYKEKYGDRVWQEAMNRLNQRVNLELDKLILALRDKQFGFITPIQQWYALNNPLIVPLLKNYFMIHGITIKSSVESLISDLKRIRKAEFDSWEVRERGCYYVAHSLKYTMLEGQKEFDKSVLFMGQRVCPHMREIEQKTYEYITQQLRDKISSFSEIITLLCFKYECISLYSLYSDYSSENIWCEHLAYLIAKYKASRMLEEYKKDPTYQLFNTIHSTAIKTESGGLVFYDLDRVYPDEPKEIYEMLRYINSGKKDEEKDKEYRKSFLAWKNENPESWEKIEALPSGIAVLSESKREKLKELDKRCREELPRIISKCQKIDERIGAPAVEKVTELRQNRVYDYGEARFYCSEGIANIQCAIYSYVREKDFIVTESLINKLFKYYCPNLKKMKHELQAIEKDILKTM